VFVAALLKQLTELSQRRVPDLAASSTKQSGRIINGNFNQFSEMVPSVST
jgi:hypothetical protein